MQLVILLTLPFCIHCTNHIMQLCLSAVMPNVMRVALHTELPFVTWKHCPAMVSAVPSSVTDSHDCDVADHSSTI